MTEYQVFNMMYVGLISNAMYFVGMVLLTWLGFRMANNIYNSQDANMGAKVFTSAFCVLVGVMMFYTQQIGAAILDTAVTTLVDIGAPSAERMQQYPDSTIYRWSCSNCICPSCSSFSITNCLVKKIDKIKGVLMAPFSCLLQNYQV